MNPTVMDCPGFMVLLYPALVILKLPELVWVTVPFQLELMVFAYLKVAAQLVTATSPVF